LSASAYNEPPPSLAYQKWEKEILATEEIVLETLCFDMGIEQPWVVLQRSLRGSDDLPLNQAESSKQAEQRAQTIEKLSEAVVAELGWAILNEAYVQSISALIVDTHHLSLFFILRQYWRLVRWCS